MVEWKKYVVVAPEVYEMIFIKAKTSVNPIASIIKQTQENLNIVWNRIGISEEEKVRLITELNKLRRATDERNATAHPIQKASTDKAKKKK